MKDERKLAEYYERLKGDVSSWSKEAKKARVTGDKNVVFSLRLPADELEALRQFASEGETSVSDLIRSAIADCIFAGRVPSALPSVVIMPSEATSGLGCPALDASLGRRTFGVVWGMSSSGQGFERIEDGGMEKPSQRVTWVTDVPVEGFVRKKIVGVAETG